MMIYFIILLRNTINQHREKIPILLRFVSSYRDLGVVVNSSLRFPTHVNVVGRGGVFMGDLLSRVFVRGNLCS